MKDCELHDTMNSIVPAQPAVDGHQDTHTIPLLRQHGGGCSLHNSHQTKWTIPQIESRSAGDEIARPFYELQIHTGSVPRW